MPPTWHPAAAVPGLRGAARAPPPPAAALAGPVSALAPSTGDPWLPEHHRRMSNCSPPPGR
eukprot:677084-Lingulodinium_polyedra.AAC.1